MDTNPAHFAPVWSEAQFAAFIANRLGDAGAAPALWRHLCYDSADVVTRTRVPCQFQQRSDFDFADWMRAMSQVVSEKHSLNREERYWHGHKLHDKEERKSTAWSTFSRIAVPSVHDDVTPGDGVWTPPTLLDEVTNIVYNWKRGTMRRFTRPHRPSMRAKVLELGLVGDDADRKLSTSAFVVPYGDLLNVLSAVLQVGKECNKPSQGSFSDLRDRSSSRFIDGGIDRKDQQLLAKRLLAVGGIQDDSLNSTVSFEEYAAFSARFNAGPGQLSFELEVTGLWCALLSSQPPPLPSALDKQLPTLVSHAFEFLYSVGEDDEGLDEHTCILLRSAKLVYASAVSGVSVDAVIGALNHECSGKFVLLHGTTAAPQRARTRGMSQKSLASGQQPAILAITAASPLWCDGDEDSLGEDYRVNENHLLLEFAPRLRVLSWCVAEEESDRVIFANHVRTTANSIAFGQSDTCPSGLALNVDTGVATLRLAADRAGQGYKEKRRDLLSGGSGAEVKQELWETVVHVQRVEVYSSASEVFLDVAVERE